MARVPRDRAAVEKRPISWLSKRAVSKLSHAEKDALIRSLLPLVGQLEVTLARIAALEAQLAELERPRKTPDNSSLPPSQGQKPDRQGGDKSPRKGRCGVARALEPNPDRVVDARLDDCPYCHTAWPGELQTAQMVYDRIEVPPVRPDVTRVQLFGGRCACCGERAVAPAAAGLEPGSNYSRAADVQHSRFLQIVSTAEGQHGSGSVCNPVNLCEGHPSSSRTRPRHCEPASARQSRQHAATSARMAWIASSQALLAMTISLKLTHYRQHQ